MNKSQKIAELEKKLEDQKAISNDLGRQRAQLQKERNDYRAALRALIEAIKTI